VSTHDVRFGGSGIPQTILPAEPPELLEAISAAAAAENPQDALSDVAATAPRSLHVWAALGESGRSVMESYAAFRVGYHRGLDTLRQNGWRGSGYVKWEHPQNRGFLRCLAGLQQRAAEIDETDEAERCALFLQQLDPSWPPSDL
jgi:hypothetical protein